MEIEIDVSDYPTTELLLKKLLEHSKDGDFDFVLIDKNNPETNIQVHFWPY